MRIRVWIVRLRVRIMLNRRIQSEFLDFVYIPPNITADHIAIMCVVAGPDARTGKDNNVRKWAEARSSYPKRRHSYP